MDHATGHGALRECSTVTRPIQETLEHGCFEGARGRTDEASLGTVVVRCVAVPASPLALQLAREPQRGMPQESNRLRAIAARALSVMPSDWAAHSHWAQTTSRCADVEATGAAFHEVAPTLGYGAL